MTLGAKTNVTHKKRKRQDKQNIQKAAYADPLEMTKHSGFTEAISDLFDSAMADSSATDDSVRHFDVTAYH